MSNARVTALLNSKFEPKHVASALEHFGAVTDKFVAEDWDSVALKSGKFVEAITKALMIYCGRALPANMRNFKAGNELKALEQTDRNAYPDTVRIVIPKACLFIYEIVNNRGGRHDAGEIDANHIDATAIVPVVQWVLAELVRFSTIGGDITSAARLIEGITEKVFPLFEKIDDRTYVTAQKLGAPAIALLLAYKAYPNAITKTDLLDAIERHGISRNAASMAITRNKTLFDDKNNSLKLRLTGRQKAEEILRGLRET